VFMPTPVAPLDGLTEVTVRVTFGGGSAAGGGDDVVSDSSLP